MRLHGSLGVLAVLAIVATGCSSSGPAAGEGAAPTGAEAVSRAESTVVGATGADSAEGQTVSGQNGTPASTDADLVGIVERFVDGFDGGAVVLWERDGEVVQVAAGEASNEAGMLEPEQAFRVGSLAKPFVATMVMQLVDEGAVDLEATLETYLPDTAVGADSTIRQLLAHESGLPSYTDQPVFIADLLADSSRQFGVDDILGWVDDVPVGPADQFAYSNTNYILAGQLIEALDDTDLNAALQNRITEPLGLQSTVFATVAGAAPSNLVGGWSAGFIDGDLSTPYEAIATSAWAAGALISNAPDLAAFLAALAGGQLLSAESLETKTTMGPAGNGLGLLSVSFSPTQVGYGHSGGIPGYTSTMAIDPVSGDTLIVLTNNDVLIADELALAVLTEL